MDIEKFEGEDLNNIFDKLKQFDDLLSNDNVDNGSIKEIEDFLETLLGGNILNVFVKKLNEKAVVPSYSRMGDAGLDLTATEIIEQDEYTISYGTGLSIEIPYGHVGLVFPRSSIKNYSLSLSNSVGVIDSNYRGEIKVVFNIKPNVNDLKIYNVGDRICQLIILPFPNVKLVVSDNLSETNRGDGGFGSSGQ